jgi:hypothetical protein
MFGYHEYNAIVFARVGHNLTCLIGHNPVQNRTHFGCDSKLLKKVKIAFIFFRAKITQKTHTNNFDNEICEL